MPGAIPRRRVRPRSIERGNVGNARILPIASRNPRPMLSFSRFQRSFREECQRRTPWKCSHYGNMKTATRARSRRGAPSSDLSSRCSCPGISTPWWTASPRIARCAWRRRDARLGGVARITVTAGKAALAEGVIRRLSFAVARYICSCA